MLGDSLHPQVYIHDIATAVPEHAYTQEFAVQFLCALPAYDERDRHFLRRIYRGTAIRKRHTVIGDYGKDPSEFTFYPPSVDLRPEPGVVQRNQLYVREADRLAVQTASKLLRQMPMLEPARITHLITVSCTGFSAPGFDLRLQKELGLSRNLHRFHLGFMGCYAALPALKLATDICRSRPEARVLVLALELCSVHFQQKAEREVMVANSLFADGAAAALVSAVPGDSAGAALRIEEFGSQYIEESEQDMAWTLGPVAFEMRLSVYVPRLIHSNIAAAVDGLLARAGLSRTDIAMWAIHPGGRAVLDKVAEALDLEQQSLWASYQVLAEYGNMSSPTILFVLEQLLRAEATGRIMAAGFGPGLTVETAFLEKRG
jgi:predicted naringenin-chalcone synthase